MSIEKEMNLTELMVLVLQSVEGDVFEALIRICQPIIYKVMGNRYIAGYDHDDLVQEAHIVLLKAIDDYKFETDMRFQQYYGRCLTNHFNSLGRKSAADKRRSLNEAISMEYISETSGKEVSEESLGLHHDPVESTIAKESYMSYAATLSDFEMAVFRLYLSNHSLDEIAEILGDRTDKVKSAVYRCSKKLRKTFS